MMLRALKRELFIRWAIVEHDKWYRQMIKTVFGSKTEMRYVLSLKRTMYNAWPEYCRRMKLPFLEGRNFPRLLGEGAKETLINYAKQSTLSGNEERRELELTLAKYPHTGHMGSQNPKLPVDVSHLEKALGDENDVLRTKWKKTNLYNWVKTLDSEANPYKPSNRASACVNRIMLPGGKCHLCKKMRTLNLRRLRQFRPELQKVYDKANGSLYGLTVGLRIGNCTDVWSEVVIMACDIRSISLLVGASPYLLFCSHLALNAPFSGTSAVERIQTLMKSPEKILGLPIYTKDTHQIHSSKVGGLIYAPKTSILDLDDVFDGESLCLIDYICTANDGCFDWPNYMMFMVKIGARSTPQGWGCDYDAQMKLVMLDTDKNDQIHGKHAPPIEVTEAAEIPSQANFSRIFDSVDTQVIPVRLYGDSDVESRGNSSNYSDVATSSWDESSTPDTEPRDGQSPEARALGRSFKLTDGDRKDRTRELATHIDNVRYVDYTSARLNQITVRWRNREKSTTGRSSKRS